MRFCSVRSVVVGAALFGAISLLEAPAFAAAPAVQGFSAIPASVAPTTDTTVGPYSSPQISVEVVLAPSNQAQLAGLLTSFYNPSSPSYQHWLKKGQFASLFAPSTAQIAAVAAYLRGNGMIVGQSSSPFLVRASGTSSAVSSAFKTSLSTYRNSSGVTYYSNASAAQLPTSLAAGVVGVVGLSNTVRLHSHIRLPANHKTPPPANCEAPYPTRAQLYAFVNNGTPFPSGYGGGPGCSGLTPAQDNSIYGAPNVGARGKGAGVNLAVFELSAYLRSDVGAWAHTFYGAAYRPPLVDIIVDGGPLGPICPAGDTCPVNSNFNAYSGDIEVDADIETDLAIAPAASHILVYNAPNDYTGQTELDEYAQIANDDLADVVSSSWGECEKDAGASLAQAENLVFEQMALQGQSIFGSAGDTGAFDCIRGSGALALNVDDPPSQPWMTSVGGTSFESYNPSANPNAVYPSGMETVWNVDNLCNRSSDEGGVTDTGFFWCAETGAGGGGNSQYWGRPFYQSGPSVTNSYTAYGDGVTRCSFAAVGAACREVPDISADADEFTPYTEFCTGNAAPPFYSNCGTFSGAQNPPGWFGIGGTSLSSPLWSAIIADRDSFQGTRSGNANQLLYLLYNLNPHGYFHDITGIRQAANNNGLFPTTLDYDLATGIGTPKMSAIITGFPQK